MDRRSRKKSKSTSKDDNGPAETRKGKNMDEASGRSRSPHEPRWVSVKSLGNATHEKATGGNTGDDSEYPTVGNSNVKQPCEEVEGVGRIWGTMRGCSSKSILTALQKLSTVSDEIVEKVQEEEEEQLCAMVVSSSGNGSYSPIS